MESRREKGTDLIDGAEFEKFIDQGANLAPKASRDLAWRRAAAKKLGIELSEVQEVVARSPGEVVELAGRKFQVQPDGSWRRI